MSRASRDKGARIEREIVALHAGLGVKAERVPLSGATRYQGNGADIDVYFFGVDAAPLVGEVKARGNGAGFATLERWLGDGDILFLRRDRAEPIAVLPWRIWARLLDATARKPLPAPLASLSQAAQDDPPQPERVCLRPVARAVVADDGREIRLTVYTEADTAAAVVLDPVRAIRIAGELIDAALPKVGAP
jgi:hypothetical protein